MLLLFSHCSSFQGTEELRHNEESLPVESVVAISLLAIVGIAISLLAIVGIAISLLAIVTAPDDSHWEKELAASPPARDSFSPIGRNVLLLFTSSP